MARKKRGHYCYGCDRFRANEKFSGKGHRKHLCKDCSKKSKTKEKVENISDYNQYIKLVKVRLVAYTDIEGFIFFEFRNHRYGISSSLEFLFYPGLIPYIYRINKDSTFELATDLQNDIDDVIHALMIKSESFYEQVIYLDELTYDVIDESGKSSEIPFTISRYRSI
jgi:hypothetical protein